MGAISQRLRLQRQFGGFEGVGLRHGVFGAVEAVEDQFAEEGESDVAEAADLLLSVFIDEEKTAVGRLAGVMQKMPQITICR